MSLKKWGLPATLMALMSLTTPAHAFALAPGSLEANLNNETIQFEYDRPVAGASNLHVHASLLYSEQHEDSTTVFATGFQGVETDNKTYRAAIGARLYGFSGPESTSGFALAFGGLFYHVIPGLEFISFGGYGYAAPKVTSFGDTEYLYELGVRAAYRVIQNTDVFVGYRYLHLKSDEGAFNDTLDDGAHLGFRVNF